MERKRGEKREFFFFFFFLFSVLLFFWKINKYEIPTLSRVCNLKIEEID